jgi:hypothetical protein
MRQNELVWIVERKWKVLYQLASVSSIALLLSLFPLTTDTPINREKKNLLARRFHQ